MMRKAMGALLALGLLTACQAPLRPVTTSLPINRTAALAAAYGLPEAPNAAAQRQFKKMDANGDSLLTEAEYVTAQMADYREGDAASVQQFLSRQFVEFDANRDKRLNLTEFIGPTKTATTAKPAAVKAPTAAATAVAKTAAVKR